jgi:ParB family chromosome partitioning protein
MSNSACASRRSPTRSATRCAPAGSIWTWRRPTPPWGDAELQLQIFAAQEQQRQHSVAGIRAALAGRVYRVADRQVRYVGLDAYVAAGGRVDRDLFMGSEDEEVVLDTALLDRLATEKGGPEAERAAVAEGYGGGILRAWGGASWSWPKTPAGYERVLSLDSLEPVERAAALVLCAIAADGSRVELTNEGFRPIPAAATATAQAAAPAPAPTAPGPPPAAPRAPETVVDSLARIRRQKIEAAALRRALPRFLGPDLEGRTFWPAADATSIKPVQEDEDSYAVAVYVKIPKADVARFMAEAEAEVDGVPPPRRPPPLDDEPEWPIARPAAAAVRVLEAVS